MEGFTLALLFLHSIDFISSVLVYLGNCQLLHLFFNERLLVEVQCLAFER